MIIKQAVKKEGKMTRCKDCGHYLSTGECFIDEEGDGSGRNLNHVTNCKAFYIPRIPKRKNP